MHLSRRKVMANILAMPLLVSSKSATAVEKSLSSDSEVFRVAFGSCAQQWLEQPVWNAIEKQKPDIFLFLGDAIYGDWDGEKVFTPTEKTLQLYCHITDCIAEFQQRFVNLNQCAI